MKLCRVFVLLLVAAGSASGQAVAPSTAALRRFADVAISPDGKHVAWIGPTDRGPNTSDKSVLLAHRDEAWKHHVLAVTGVDAANASEVAFSADGQHLAVITSRELRGAPQAVVQMVDVDYSKTTWQLLLPGTIHDARWSPDGTRIAVLYASPAEQSNSPVAATPRDTGVMDSHIDRQHLAIIDVETRKMKSISPADQYIYEFDWAPDSKRLVITNARGSGNNNWWVASLSTIDAATGEMKELVQPDHQIAQPRYSPDGSTIAYIGGLMSDQGVTGGDLFVIPVAGGKPRDITPRITSSIASFSWTSPSTMFTAGYAQGRTQIGSVDTKTGALTEKWAGDEHLSIGTIAGVAAVAVSRDGAATAAVRESFAAPPEIWVGDANTSKQLTHANDGVASALGKGVSVKWKSETFNVQGFLVYPANFDATKKYPMIVQVHGGPSSSVKPTFFAPDSYEALESKAGYFVFLPNPRGSYGQGEAFTRANIKDFGHGDLRDIMAGVDQVLRQFPVDSTRMGIRGWSYGGFMTMWAVTQTNRFKAAVTGAGISNWLSYTGQNGIAEWMVPFFGETAYENKAVYDRSSPINFIGKAKTPTLVVVGERDAECPAPQSIEFWRGLQHAGVNTRLIIYPDEGHGFVMPEHVRDVREQTVKWMDTYLKGPKM